MWIRQGLEAHARAERPALVALDGQGTLVAELSYAELSARAKALAVRLPRDAGPAFLLADQAPDFMVGFCAALLAGVPVSPLPAVASGDAFVKVPGLGRRMADAGSRLLIGGQTETAVIESHRDLLGIDTQVQIFTVDQNQEVTGFADCGLHGPACLLYTSGSTSEPKGVPLTADQLAYNGRTCAEAWQIDSNSVLISWMPFHHSFGLVFNLLIPLFSGARLVWMPPKDVMFQPRLWFDAVTRYRGTHTAVATFGYRRCYNLPDDHWSVDTDLSSLQVSLIAAEPIQRGVFDQFLKRFSRFGFKPEAFCVLYGLSESGPITTMEAGEAPRFHQTDPRNPELAAACVGKAFPGSDVRVFPPTGGEPLSSNASGEICIEGPSVFNGYHARPDANQKRFFEWDGRTWFRTGDIGFLDEGGYLFITGRLKEMVIIRGKNYYPQDIEWLAGQAPLAEKRRECVAFAEETDGDPALVLMVEAGPEEVLELGEDWAASFQQRLTKHLDIGLRELVFVAPGSIQKTAGGKPRRALTAAQYRDGRIESSRVFRFEPSSEDAPRDAGLEARFLSLFVSASGLSPGEIDLTCSLEDLALDSARFLSLAEEISRIFKCDCHPSVFFQFSDLAGIFEHLFPEVRG